ncbi:MAG: hypothetical protein JXA21_05970 [Anaerolineae bacterium]|nr:hypothetical protein [Anaerolineae bacterium]
MTPTLIEPQLYQRIEQIAREQSTTIGDILNSALQLYLWELDRRKIAEESAHYRQQHSQLRQEYLGDYIAMHQGIVVDHDKDFAQLRQRVRQRFPRVAVMMTLVTEEADSTLVRDGFLIAGDSR